MPTTENKQFLLFSLYSLLIIAFFLFFLGILASVTNSWMYFNILSEKTGLSIMALKNIHYAFVTSIAILWAFDAYKSTHERHLRLPFKKHELIDHHTMRILKSLFVPFFILVSFLLIATVSLIQTYGPLVYEVRVQFPNDPTLFEFFALTESIILALLAVAAHFYLIRRLIYWLSKDK